MKHPGSKENSFLNGEWKKHGKKYGKKLAARIRRAIGKELINKELHEKD
jgi:hypothetical protein